MVKSMISKLLMAALALSSNGGIAPVGANEPGMVSAALLLVFVIV